MRQPLYKIRELIKELPKKDALLCERFFNERKFTSILEIVESDIYKAKEAINPDELLEEDEEAERYISKLLELKDNLEEYISYLDIPSDSDYYNDYYDY